MPRTPAVDQNAKPEPAKSRTAYIPVLPEGWSCSVTLRGPDNQSVEIYRDLGEHAVIVNTGETPHSARRIAAPNLGEGVKVGVRAAKALTRLRAQRSEYESAKEEALRALGEDEPATPSGLQVFESGTDDAAGDPDAEAQAVAGGKA
jgi:hypothetical protein